MDQRFWAKRVHELGMGPEAIPIDDLSSPHMAGERLQGLLRHALAGCGSPMPASLDNVGSGTTSHTDASPTQRPVVGESRRCDTLLPLGAKPGSWPVPWSWAAKGVAQRLQPAGDGVEENA